MFKKVGLLLLLVGLLGGTAQTSTEERKVKRAAAKAAHLGVREDTTSSKRYARPRARCNMWKALTGVVVAVACLFQPTQVGASVSKPFDSELCVPASELCIRVIDKECDRLLKKSDLDRHDLADLLFLSNYVDGLHAKKYMRDSELFRLATKMAVICREHDIDVYQGRFVKRGERLVNKDLAEELVDVLNEPYCRPRTLFDACWKFHPLV